MGMWSEWRGGRQGWSRQTRVVAVIVGMALVVAWAVAIDHARGAELTRSAAPSAHRCVPPGGGDETCEEWAKRHAKRFRDGKTGNSKGIQKELMPKKKWNRLMRAAVKKYKRGHPERFQHATRGFGDWCSVCDYFFEAERCMASAFQPGSCAEAYEDAETIDDIGREISWLTIKCGGGAVIGGGATRSAGGAIFGGVLACGWGQAADLARSGHPSGMSLRPVARPSRALRIPQPDGS